MLFSSPGFYCVVAESEGRIVGSNCLDERSLIAGIGPITVDPGAQNLGVGRKLGPLFAQLYGTGAYVSAVLQVRFGLDAWTSAALAVAAGALVGAFVGALSFRYGLRGSYFALVTLAFAEVFRILANSVGFTGAGVGLLVPLKSSALDFQFQGKAGFLYVILALTLAGFLLSWWLKRSRYGAWLTAVRDNEDSAAALGVDVFRVKLQAIVLSAALMAAGGAFYVQYFQYIDPHLAYGPAVSVEALLGPIVGGLGTAFGPLLGAAALRLLGELTRNLLGDAPGVSLMIYGAVLIAMVTFLPRGIGGLFRRFKPGAA